MIFLYRVIFLDKRIDWIDSLKGLGIILVVWGHMNIPLTAETIIYSFHMPLFFFISGYLYKSKKRAIGEVFYRKSKTLLTPYFYFALISIPFGILLSILFGGGINWKEVILNFFYLDGFIGWNAPIWFLIVLFIVEVVYFLIDKTMKFKTIFIGLSFIIAYFMTKSGYMYPFGLHIASWAIVFYYLGHLCREKDVVEKLSKSITFFIISLVFLTSFNLVFGILTNIRVSVYRGELGNYFYFYISAIAGVLFLFVLMRKLPVSKLLKFFGENTLLILATHYFFIYGFRAIDNIIVGFPLMDKDSYLTSILLTIIVLGLYIPIALFVNRYMPFLLGRSKATSNPKLTTKAT